MICAMRWLACLLQKNLVLKMLDSSKNVRLWCRVKGMKKLLYSPRPIFFPLFTLEKDFIQP